MEHGFKIKPINFIILILLIAVTYYAFIPVETTHKINKTNPKITVDHQLNNSLQINKARQSEKTPKINIKFYKKHNVDSIPLVQDRMISNVAKREFEPQNNANKEIIAKQLLEVRYKQYLRDCIAENFGNLYKTEGIKAEILFKVNKQGYVEAYTISGVSDPETRKYNISSEEKDNVKQKLEQAFLKASPFQPFPLGMDKEYIITGMGIGCNNIHEIIYGKFNPPPNWAHTINQTGKTKNPKKYEDSKITYADVYVEIWDANQLHKTGMQLYNKDANLIWEPVKTVNNHVIVRAKISRDGKITEPAFIKKSSYKEANEAAIKPLEYIDTSRIEYWINRFHINLSPDDTVFLELHFVVK